VSNLHSCARRRAPLHRCTHLHNEGGGHPNQSHDQDERVSDELIDGYTSVLYQRFGALLQTRDYPKYMPIDVANSSEYGAGLQPAAAAVTMPLLGSNARAQEQYTE
jgi:hypothetical protein